MEFIQKISLGFTIKKEVSVREIKPTPALNSTGRDKPVLRERDRERARQSDVGQFHCSLTDHKI
jgi:hypothetical protein